MQTPYAIKILLLGIAGLITPTSVSALDCVAARHYHDLVLKACNSGNADSCSALPAYLANVEKCDLKEQDKANTQNNSQQDREPPVPPTPQKIVTASQIQKEYGQEKKCKVTNTWDGFYKTPGGVGSWVIDYLVNRCSVPQTIILVIDGHQTIYRTQRFGIEIKHYRRNTNDVSYRWCSDTKFEQDGDC